MGFWRTAGALAGLGIAGALLLVVLRALRPQVIVGTKCRLPDTTDVPGALTRSVENSLKLLGLERLDLFHLHNPIGRVRESGDWAWGRSWMPWRPRPAA